MQKYAYNLGLFCDKNRGSKPLEISFGFLKLGKEALFRLKLAGVDAAAARLDPDRMLEVEHLVVEQVLNGAPWSIGTVEDAADNDGVVGRVVVAQHTARVKAAPGEGRPAKQPVEEAHIERLEYLFKVEVMAAWREDAFPSAGLTDVFSLPRDCLRGDVTAVAVGVDGRDRLFVELGQQDVGNRAVNRLRGRFEKVGEADVQAALAETNRGVQRSEAAETDVERRNGRSGAKVAVLLLENADQAGV